MPDKKNIIAPKPRIGGVMFHAPAGTTLPTDATSELSSDFKEVGYISEDGIVFSKERSSEDLKEMGSQNVKSMQTEYSETADFKMLEYLNPEALKISFGDDNVSGSLEEAGIMIRSNANELPEGVYVFDLIDGDVLIRKVLPLAQVSGQGEIEYKAGSAVMLPIKLKLFPYNENDWEGDYHREYIAKAGSSVPETRLSALSVGNLSLTPTFDKDVLSYECTTENASNTITATPMNEDAEVEITCDDTTYESGDSITWEVGENEVLVKVTNGNAVKTYTIIVTKSE